MLQNICDTHNHHQNCFGGWTFRAQKLHLRIVPTHYRILLAYPLRKYNEKELLH